MTDRKQDKPRIAIFKNTYKTKEGDKFAPSDYNGTITLPEGLPAGEYSVGIYMNESKNGLKYMSGNIRPARSKESKPVEPESSMEEASDEIPF